MENTGEISALIVQITFQILYLYLYLYLYMPVDANGNDVVDSNRGLMVIGKNTKQM